MKWRNIVLFTIIAVMSIIAGLLFLFQWGASSVRADCSPQGNSSDVLSRIDAYNADLSPFQQLSLTEDEVTLLVRQTLGTNACAQIRDNNLIITIPGSWLAYSLLLTPLETEPFLRIETIAINGVTMPGGLTETYNQQMNKAWRDFSYDLNAKRTLTRIRIDQKTIVIEGEIPPSL